MSEKIDVVYILRNTSKWQNNEIRYSLRSIEKNAKDIAGKVFLIGFCPKFIDTNELVHIVANDPYANKLRNAIYKIKIACHDPRVSEKFMLMNDDFFIMRKMEYVQNYSKGSLRHSEKRHRTKAGYYFKAIKETRKSLREIGIESPIDYETHTPIMIEKKKFIALENRFNMMGHAHLFRSVYCNVLGITGKDRRDVKIYWRDSADIEKIKKLDILSTDDKVVMDVQMQKFLKRRFSNPSKYEKGKVGIYRATRMFTYSGRTYNSGDIIRIGDVPERLIAAAGLRLDSKMY